jgi:hypothetical protein
LVADSLTTSVTRDHRGDVIRTKSPGGLLTDTNYDGVGRQTVSYVDYGSDIGAGTATWGGPGWTAVVGDWDGSGHTEIGTVDPSGNWYLITSTGTLIFQFGQAGWIPVVGYWDGNGTTTVGMWHGSTGTWHLRNSNSAGPDNLTFSYGGSPSIPVTGDWAHTGHTGIGVIDTNFNWYLRNTASGEEKGTQLFSLDGNGRPRLS